MPLMDINYLLHREQISLAKANTAMSPEARRAHSGLARGDGAKLPGGGYAHRAPIAWPIAPPSQNHERDAALRCAMRRGGPRNSGPGAALERLSGSLDTAQSPQGGEERRETSE